ncbi:MAG: ASKHA domain-containing protein [Lachnospiraceae bacterium]|nr:ASKHA domain-containing protein [Lachnospiraceae bacterium]
MTNGITRKIYMELTPPTEQDNVSAERRILSALEAALQPEVSEKLLRPDTSQQSGVSQRSEISQQSEISQRSETLQWSETSQPTELSGRPIVTMPLSVMRKLHPLCEKSAWKLTASLAWDGCRWEVTALEAGDTSMHHYGLAVDLGSTTVVMQLVDCNTGEIVLQESAYNQQIAFGEDILTRIFYSKDNPEHLEEIRLATVNTIVELMVRIEAKTGVSLSTGLQGCADLAGTGADCLQAKFSADTNSFGRNFRADTGLGVAIDSGRKTKPAEHAALAGSCISMVIAGNTTMMHFLLGLDAFCVFSSPYAVWADQPGFIKGADLDIPIPGYVYCYPGKANYLGGDIISGMVATDMYRRDSISVFFDVGTNGELVVGNRDFLLCGAGAAGPALEGGVVKTGMRAAKGAVQHVRFVRESGGITEKNSYTIELDVLGGGAPEGICGSGIIDLISELFLHGVIDLRGRLVPEVSDAVVHMEPGEYAFQYAPGLYFYQSDITEFIRTKAAAYTMMDYLMSETGMSLDDVSDFYMAGAFGSHVNKESAVNIGMYPDVAPERIHAEGNTSLEGARELLLDRQIVEELPEILDLMTYVQFGAVEDFLEKMTAASALPHTDLERYPSVKARLQEMK